MSQWKRSKDQVALVLKAFQGILKCSGSWESQSCYFVIPGAPGKRQWRMGTCQTLKEDPSANWGPRRTPMALKDTKDVLVGDCFRILNGHTPASASS